MVGAVAVLEAASWVAAGSDSVVAKKEAATWAGANVPCSRQALQSRGRWTSSRSV